MKIRLISKIHNYIFVSNKIIYEYDSDYIPNVGEYVLYGEYETFLVKEKAFDMRTNTIQLYGNILDVDNNVIEAEEYLKYLEKCTKEYMGQSSKVIITPTTGNPKERQYDVSFMVLKRDERGLIPRFEVNVVDLIKSK